MFREVGHLRHLLLYTQQNNKQYPHHHQQRLKLQQMKLLQEL
jgi:hypothetical protein